MSGPDRDPYQRLNKDHFLLHCRSLALAIRRTPEAERSDDEFAAVLEEIAPILEDLAAGGKPETQFLAEVGGRPQDKTHSRSLFVSALNEIWSRKQAVFEQGEGPRPTEASCIRALAEEFDVRPERYERRWEREKVRRREDFQRFERMMRERFADRYVGDTAALERWSSFLAPCSSGFDQTPLGNPFD